jgi:hypothetical protein
MRNAEQIDAIFQESWTARYDAITDAGQPSESARGCCPWLYYGLTMDAARRITPCCLPPMGQPDPRHLVYASFDGKNTREVVNSPDAVRARRDCRSGYQPGQGREPLPYCIRCDQNPPPPMLADVAAYLQSVDDRRALPSTIPAALRASRLFMWSPKEVNK